MIEYDNGSQFKILFSHILSGSVFPAALPIGILSGGIGLCLALLRKFDSQLFEGQDDYLFNPFAMTTNCSVIGYLLVVRTNMALSRWMEGISDIQTMLSKWGDAYNSLTAMFAGRDEKPNTTEADLERVMLFRTRIAHWFSLMSCMAFATLRGSEVISLDDIQIKELLVSSAASSVRDGNREKHSFTSRSTSERLESPSSVMSAGRGRASTMIDQSHLEDSLANKKREMQAEQLRELDLFVLANPSSEELELIEMASDKVNVICLWIIQGIIEEVRYGTLDIPAPIATRVFQELSTGMLGFNQAHKVAMVPFPFPFAQMVSLLLMMLYLCLPFYVDNFTQNVWLTPVICFVVPFCYCGLNNIAIELEEPFGTDANDVDIADRHRDFLWSLVDTLRQPTRPPVAENHSLERKIRDRVSRGLPGVKARLSGNNASEGFASLGAHCVSLADVAVNPLPFVREGSRDSDVPGSQTSRLTPDPIPAAEGISSSSAAGDGTSIGFGPICVLHQSAQSTPRILGDEDKMSTGSLGSRERERDRLAGGQGGDSAPSCVGDLLSVIACAPACAPQVCVQQGSGACTNFECDGNAVSLLGLTAVVPSIAPVCSFPATAQHVAANDCDLPTREGFTDSL